MRRALEARSRRYVDSRFTNSVGRITAAASSPPICASSSRTISALMRRRHTVERRLHEQLVAGVKFDAIGPSCYGYRHGSLYDFQTTLDDAASRYGEPVFVAETAHPFRLDSEDTHEEIINTTGELVSGYPANTAGQRRWVNDVTSIVEAVPNGRGLGVFCWEATWTAVSGNGWDPTDAAYGNGWENQALFGYDDKALSSMAWFSHRWVRVIPPRSAESATKGARPRFCGRAPACPVPNGLVSYGRSVPDKRRRVRDTAASTAGQWEDA